MADSSEKMPPYPDIFTDDFQMSDQVMSMLKEVIVFKKTAIRFVKVVFESL